MATTTDTGTLPPGAPTPPVFANSGDPGNPLDQLRDIHLPPATETWPPAVGWWVIGIALLALLALGMKLRGSWLRRRREKAFVREARQMLGDIQTRFEQGQPVEPLAAELSVLVRRVFLSLRPRREVAGKHGRAWLDYLASETRNPAFADEVGDIFLDAPYQSAAVDRHYAARFETALVAVDDWLQISTRAPEQEA